MPPIIVNARFLTQPVTGVQRFAIEVSKRLKQKLPDIEFIAPPHIIHQELAASLQVVTYGRFNSHYWEQIELPVYLRKQGNPLLINLANTAPLFYRNQIVSVLDLSFLINPLWFSRSFAMYYSFVVPRIARNAKKIITISENSRNDIKSRLGIRHENIEVIYCSVSDAFREANTITIKPAEEKYILAVSSLDPRKNFVNLIKAFIQAGLPDVKLVIVGSANKVFADQGIKPLIQNNDKIIFTGYISDKELIGLYSNALLFLYPSLYEGFGIPPLEAMACGCPTIVSDIASLPEVCGDASYYIDPTNVDSIAQGIVTLVRDEKLRKEFTDKGYERVALFSWENSVDNLISLIRS
jgi:glycosyltransferase involved in cell wall biosynthesis